MTQKISPLTDEKTMRFFQRAVELLVGHQYLIFLSHAIKPVSFMEHEFDYHLDDLSPGSNVFKPSLLLYGYSIELLLKSMFVFKTQNLEDTIKWDHNIKGLLDKISILYGKKFPDFYYKFFEQYEQIIVWSGRYPFPKRPQKPIDDLVLMQEKTKEVWVNLLDTFTETFDNEQLDNFKTLVWLTLGEFISSDIVTNQDFYDATVKIALGRIKSVSLIL